MATQLVGLDIGYGFTKVTDGQRTLLFPSVAGDAVRAGFDNDVVRSDHGQTISLGGQEWFYGVHAQKHSRNPLALYARERTEQRTLIRLLFCAAMTELAIDGRVSLCTGLPVDWFSDREDLEGQLLGDHTFTADGIGHSVYVCRIATVPQPFGSFFDQVLDADGKLINAAFARGKVGLLDIGTFTCDLALSDGLEYVAKASGSKTVAMSSVWRDVRDGLRSRYGLDYELHQIDRILRDGLTVTVEGQDRNIEDLVRPAVDALAEQVIAFARERWGKARDFKRIMLTGGAYHIADAVKRVYPHTLVLAEPHLGNVRGYLKYAVRKFGG